MGTQAHDTITPTNFAQLDLVLIENKWSDKIIDIQSSSNLPLSSQHFLIWCTLDVCIEKEVGKSMPKSQNVDLLKNPDQAEMFSNEVVELVSKQLKIEEQNNDILTSPSYLNNIFVEAVQNKSTKQLPLVPKKQVKPWITVEAFALIDQRVLARKCGTMMRRKN